MSIIMEKKSKTFNNADVIVEMFNNAGEVVDVTNSRGSITDKSFHDMRKPNAVDSGWCGGVKSLSEAQEMMKTGYQPTVDKMKSSLKIKASGSGKRFAFQNNVEGFAPIVPLALLGVPNCMQNMQMKPIKTKVLDVYYDMTSSCGTSSETIIRYGQQLLGAIIELEHQGYRFNLYAIQTYYGNASKDGKNTLNVLCAKVKSSNTAIDLKRISFPLTHTAFFRVIGFDWYSRCPKAKYIPCYGHALGYDFDEKKMREGFEEIFGHKCMVFSAANMKNKDKDSIKEVLSSDK